MLLMASIIQHLSYDFEDLENIAKMVAETSEASKDQQSESATGENNTCTCTCRLNFLPAKVFSRNFFRIKLNFSC